METPYRLLVAACVGGLLVADILWTLIKLIEVSHG
jgi:hypothetical protein